MSNLLKKAQILQFIIIISFFIISNITKDEVILDKNSEYYNFLINIVKYNNILKSYNKDSNNVSKNDLLIFSEKNEYFYYFHNNHNIFAYFFKEKESNVHEIYFNGINNINDIKTVINILINNFTFDSIKDILHKPGNFFIINNGIIEQMNDSGLLTIFDVFNIFYESIYIENTSNASNASNSSNASNKVNLKINGYSLGGPISQIFVYLLYDIYKDNFKNKFNLTVYNIESWFACNSEKYDEFINMSNLKNIYNKRSILFFFNKFFQRYNKIDYFIENTDITDNNMDIYLNNILPKGIIKYIKNYHLLSKIFKNELK
jgi:hypothetical protein